MASARQNSPSPELEDFWKEFKDIESSKEPDAEDEDLSKTPDEGEQEAAWLQEAGYGFLVSKMAEDGKELSDEEINALTSPLSSHHANAVRKRVDTLNATLRKKQKYTTKIDVRNIFPQQNSTGTHPPQATITLTNTDTAEKQVHTRQVSPRSPTTNQYVTNIYIEAPKSPSSPGSDSGLPEQSNIRRTAAVKGREKSFLRRGGYSMTGQTEEVQDNVEMGVEMSSVQTRDTHQRHDSESYKRSSQLSPISDTDIMFDLNVEEDKTDRNETKPTRKSLHKDDLPSYNLVYDPLGITHIDDVSPADMGYVRSVALLELTSILDNHSILYTRRRSKRKHKEQGVFGVPLSTLLEFDQKKKSSTKIPLVFTEIIFYLVKHGLDSEGLLRVPGLVSRVQQLRQDMEEKFYQGTFTWSDDLTPNDVAALLKQFLRELPSPLLTDEYIEAFAQVENLPDRKLQLHALNLLILLLPNVHRNTLGLLLEFLEQVESHSSMNRMSLANVAMIMAPNLFLAPKVRPLQAGKAKGNWDLQMNIATGTSNVIRMLIKYRKILWTIPSNILSHVRRSYELEQIRKNKDKSKNWFHNKKDKTDVYKKPALVHEADFQEGVIRVQAPTLTKSSTAIQLDDQMTAKDIVTKFRVIQGSQTWDSRKSSQLHKVSLQVSRNASKFSSAGDGTYLHEVGGNIGERCLPHNTNMLALYKVNPNAEWIIKQKGS